MLLHMAFYFCHILYKIFLNHYLHTVSSLKVQHVVFSSRAVQRWRWNRVAALIEKLCFMWDTQVVYFQTTLQTCHSFSPRPIGQQHNAFHLYELAVYLSQRASKPSCCKHYLSLLLGCRACLWVRVQPVFHDHSTLFCIYDQIRVFSPQITNTI